MTVANDNRVQLAPFSQEADREIVLGAFSAIRGAAFIALMSLALFAFFYFDGGIILAAFIEGMNDTIIAAKG